MLAATVAAAVGFAVCATLAALHSQSGPLGDLDTGLVMVCAFGFFTGSLAHQLCRLGWTARNQEPPAAAPPSHFLDDDDDDDGGGLVVLVPSYKEEARVVKRTLLSAAFQQCQARRVVLLIDDPPAPPGSGDDALLAAARSLADEVGTLLGQGRTQVASDAAEARARLDAGAGASEVTAVLAGGHRWLAGWLEQLAEEWEVRDHEDTLFVDRVLLGVAAINRGYAAELERRPVARPDDRALRPACARLAAQLAVTVESFARKQYVNTNHEPNKAMNLNTYLSLLGRTILEACDGDGRRLRLARPNEQGTLVPDAAFALTLDADSLLLPDYAPRLLHHLRAPGNERVAVAQTPYSAIPGAPGGIERAAGATTDVQHIIHQGFTRFGATFWVGANALLRVEALRDIAVWESAADLPLARFIQDRTVIEDTESSIDLRNGGWQLYNYPARLSYSSTPPDFGSLLIQRRRWANGGLLVLPKLLRHVHASPEPARRRYLEGFLRFYYLTSIAWVNIGFIAMFVLSYRPVTPLLFLATGSLPYFAAYASDLRSSGHRARELLSVYALNLILVPVNLGGVLKSLRQAATGRKTPFARTPKVEGRTLSPPLYVTLELLGAAYLTFGAISDLLGHRWLNGVLDLANLGILAYGISWLIGLPAVCGSLQLALTPLRPRGSRPDLAGTRETAAKTRLRSARLARRRAVTAPPGGPATARASGRCEVAERPSWP